MDEVILSYLADDPQEEREAYERSLKREAPQYEAKIMLVGEGGVGKTSLKAALCGEPFVVNRSTTHGIELGSLRLPRHPQGSSNETLALNFWDFGGQEVYRITHQLFFSQSALYLLVWKPREGQEANALAEWIERIMLRVGQSARILIVATHCKERFPELDFPALKTRFCDVLVASYEVDSEDGTGIAQLRHAIVETSAAFEHMGIPISRSWLNVRDILATSRVPTMSFADYLRLAKGPGLDEIDARALLKLLHVLGHVVYYDADGLRDFVVLKPEWLTKAIGFVLEDRPTRQAGGVLDHRRLRAIWSAIERPTHEQYSSQHFPFFLRLMEKYDISARIEGRDASLVAQLVPYERPELRWGSQGAVLQGQTSLVWKLHQHPPGLVAWTTVRNHRWSTGKHWRNGVFLRHEHGHEALIELMRDGELAITVRGSYPSHFMSLLQDGFEQLIKQRWEYLRYELFVPCPNDEDGHHCNGRFELATLQNAAARGRSTWPCAKCLADVDVARLLTGFLQPKGALAHQLEEAVAELRASTQLNQQHAARSAEMMRRVLRTFVDDARRAPRLFSLQPRQRSGWRSLSAHQHELTLWCEHPGGEHPCGADGSYVIETPREWLVAIGPYVAVVAKALRIAMPISSGAVGLDPGWSEALKPQLAFMEKLTSSLLTNLHEPDDRVDDQALARLEAAGLRELHMLLEKVDPQRTWGGLTRVLTTTADVLWVCPRHHKLYDPGLPRLPAQI